MDSVFKTGVYNLKKIGQITFDNKGNDFSDSYFNIDTIEMGTLNINKLDTVRKIISGTFDVNMRGKNDESLKISDGRFDTKYY